MQEPRAPTTLKQVCFFVSQTRAPREFIDNSMKMPTGHRGAHRGPHLNSSDLGCQVCAFFFSFAGFDNKGVRPKSPGLDAKGWGSYQCPGQLKPPTKWKGVRPKSPGLEAEWWGSYSAPGHPRPLQKWRGLRPTSPGFDAKGWGSDPSPGHFTPRRRLKGYGPSPLAWMPKGGAANQPRAIHAPYKSGGG